MYVQLYTTCGRFKLFRRFNVQRSAPNSHNSHESDKCFAPLAIIIANLFTHNRDPEYYAELLGKTSRPADPPSAPLDVRTVSFIGRFDERYCSDVPSIRNVDDALTQRLQTLLGVVADISLCQRQNISATMARLGSDSGTLQTRLYIVFKHENDETARRCPGHLTPIF